MQLSSALSVLIRMDTGNDSEKSAYIIVIEEAIKLSHVLFTFMLERNFS